MRLAADIAPARRLPRPRLARSSAGCVFDRVGRYEDVTIEFWHRRVGHDKTITVVMEDQASFDFVVMRKRGPLDLLRLVRTRLLAGRLPIRLAAREPVSAAG